jgi:hypothetical protein
MKKRERQVRSARRQISDARLIAFLDAASRSDRSPFAVELIRKMLGEGKSFDEIFYDGDDLGFLLSVDQTSASDFKIEFG